MKYDKDGHFLVDNKTWKIYINFKLQPKLKDFFLKNKILVKDKKGLYVTYLGWSFIARDYPVQYVSSSLGIIKTTPQMWKEKLEDRYWWYKGKL
jgi:hypothetical protein